MKIKYGYVFTLFSIVLLCSLILTSCVKYTTSEYHEKTDNSLVDSNVKIEYFSKVDKSNLLLQFVQKEIPFEMDIICGANADKGGIEISGFLEKGEIIISLLNSSGEFWKRKYSAGTLKEKDQFEIYWGTYTLRLEFNGAVNGDIQMKYRTQKLLGIF